MLHIAQELLERSKGKTSNLKVLLLLSLKKWEQGSRSRQIARRSLTKFLDWATQRNIFTAENCPSLSVPEVRKPKRICYAFIDQEKLEIGEQLSTL